MYLINELSAILVLSRQYNSPQIWVLATHQVASLTLEQGVLIAHLKKAKRKVCMCVCMYI